MTINSLNIIEKWQHRLVSTFYDHCMPLNKLKILLLTLKTLLLMLHFLMINIVWMTKMCQKNEDVIRVCMQVKELVDMTDRYIDGVLNRRECSEIIECLCTELRFYIRTC